MLEDDIEDDVDDNKHIDFKPFGISPASEPQGKPPGPVPVLPGPVCPSPDCEGAKIQGRVRTARFTAFNGRRDALEAAGVKLTGINATVAQDLEPEYTTFSQDEKIAFVSLQVRRHTLRRCWLNGI
jgi:hypothetical protein